ncbi:MAG: hypothetical protein LBS54_03930 [Dysgonamonadaceae bacterium]|nr:hypothetical protein [Dysgonamonadaceae bacterium]
MHTSEKSLDALQQFASTSERLFCTYARNFAQDTKENEKGAHVKEAFDADKPCPELEHAIPVLEPAMPVIDDRFPVNGIFSDALYMILLLISAAKLQKKIELPNF